MRCAVLPLLLLPALAHSQVLQESSHSLGKGFREVHRSQVNPAGGFEEIGHFTFVYFKQAQLCQCGAREFFISPTGKHAIFINERSGSVTLFNARTNSSKALTPGFVALIGDVQWNEATNAALVVFEHASAGAPTPSPLQVLLKSGT